MTERTSSKLESFASKLAILYILMLALPISLVENRIYLHDALLPVMGIIILLRRQTISHYVVKYGYLIGFLLVALAATAIHAMTALPDAYEWIVFAYQAVLFVFFAETILSPRTAMTLGIALFTATLLAFCYEMTGMPSHFSYLSPEMQDTSMAFLVKRFQFTLKNPNFFGVFYAIPCALTTRLVAKKDWASVKLFPRICLLLLPVLLMLPILSSASKHGIIPAALFLSWPYYLFPQRQYQFKPLALLAVLGMMVIFETTVLFTTFPLSKSSPFINTTPGMYSLHQTTYAKLVTTPPSRLLLGLGATKARQHYPFACNPEQVTETLRYYNATSSYKTFTTYMDPHQEYLNLTCLFGLPAAVLMVLFWLTLPRQASRELRFAVALFIMAALSAALWDDLFSKRFLWIAAAILVPTKEQDD